MTCIGAITFILLLLIFVDGHFRNKFSSSLIRLSPTFLWAQFMYYNLFHYFYPNPSHFIILIMTQAHVT